MSNLVLSPRASSASNATCGPKLVITLLQVGSVPRIIPWEEALSMVV